MFRSRLVRLALLTIVAGGAIAISLHPRGRARLAMPRATTAPGSSARDALATLAILARKLVISVRRVGLAETLRLCFRYYYYAWEFTPAARRRKRQPDDFDRRHGVYTGLILDPGEMSIGSGDDVHGHRHQASPPERVREILAGLDVPFEDRLFVDFGSGTGRALLLASELPFKRIVGVERWEPLHRQALENFRRYQGAPRRCTALEALCMDAAEYVLPPEPAVLYFFNPFGEPVLQRVLDNVERSLGAAPRDVTVVYFNPKFARVFERSPHLVLAHDLGDCRIYRSVAVADRAAVAGRLADRRSG